MTPYLHAHDPEVFDAEYADLMDRHRDERPTRADVDDTPEPMVPKVAFEPCEDCTHLLCALQRSMRGRS